MVSAFQMPVSTGWRMKLMPSTLAIPLVALLAHCHTVIKFNHSSRPYCRPKLAGSQARVYSVHAIITKNALTARVLDAERRTIVIAEHLSATCGNISQLYKLI